MKKRTLIKVFLAFIFVVFISCKNNKSRKYENEKNILIKSDGSPVELELRLGENKELTSFLLKDESQEFSLMLNLLIDGNYSLKIQTNLIDNTVNTEVCDTNNRYISQSIDIKNKLFLHQEINNDGSVNSQSKITAHQ